MILDIFSVLFKTGLRCADAFSPCNSFFLFLSAPIDFSGGFAAVVCCRKPDVYSVGGSGFLFRDFDRVVFGALVPGPGCDGKADAGKRKAIPEVS
ncbi:hypothetical protein [uncultured Pseudodesulfovibrio sp.]|uniref:hypothetical protein n=1 Tax=uncultured Pseudodesulfovibrio sp. TaxID=2035858 RepID=UPI0029C96642|nr:hypothetical protein [uncultured Pseudodesulfovibrio sp.]